MKFVVSKLLRFIRNFSRSEVSNFDKVCGVGEYGSRDVDDVFGRGWAGLLVLLILRSRTGWQRRSWWLRGETVTTAGVRNIRGRRSVRWSLDGWNGLVFKTGRLVVFVEIGLQGEGFVTAFAIEVFESRMGLHVSTKIGPVSKGFPTVSTSIGFISSV